MLKIDKNIPIAPRGRSGGRRVGSKKYPFSDLEIEDSFLVSTPDTREHRCYQGVILREIMRTSKSLKNKKFITRYVPGGIRVWRVNDDGSIPDPA